MTLKNKIYKSVTPKSKNKYIDKLLKIVKQYKNAIYGTSKMRLVDVQPETFIDLDAEINIKNSKFKVIVHEQISNYGNIFSTGYKSK